MAAAQAKLRQPRAFAHQHRERLRRDFGIERPVIAGLDAVEAARAIGDDAGEHVEPAGRAFRIGRRRDVGRQREAFDQRHDVDAAGLQHRAVAERDLVQLQVLDALRDRACGPAGSSRARDRRCRRGAGRGSRAGSDRARSRARAESRPPSRAPRSCGRAGCPCYPPTSSLIILGRPQTCSGCHLTKRQAPR